MKDNDMKYWYDILIIMCFLVLVAMCSCKTKYIETIHYTPVEVHDTLYNTKLIRDSITLHDSVFIHQKGDTVYSEKWRTEHHWHTKHDTLYKSKEVPKVVTDTIVTIREVPVDKIVYKQHWWQRLLSGAGGIALILFGLYAAIRIRK